MAVDRPVQIKQQTITSTDAVSFSAGLDERGDYNIPINSYSYGRNAWVNNANNIVKRLTKKRWLPDTVGFNGEIAKVYYNGHLYFFIADAGKVKYCEENATSWTNCGGSNTITTTAGVITTFMRTNDILLCMNGIDNLRYIDLATLNMTVFTSVVQPTSTLTATATGITASGAFKTYYAITYSSDGGGDTGINEAKILTQAVSKSRSTWKSDGTEYLTIAFNDTPPAGATGRIVWGAVAIAGTTPVASDLIKMSDKIPLATTSFSDNGLVPFDITAGVGTTVNTTAGVKASAGTMAGDTPVLYGNPDSPYDLYFAGITDTGISFSPGDGAQTMPLNKGTDYYPTSVVGFRNNQNIPSLFSISSSVDGIGKQDIISQKTITYGNQAKQYWDYESLNTGANAVYAKYGVVNYLGKLIFPGSNGVNSIDTKAQIQNVLSQSIISNQIANTYASIKNANFDKIVGTAWNNYVLMTVPSQRYNYNNQIIIYDLVNIDAPKWAIWDLPADWIGTVSPPNQASFPYIRQGNKIYKLVEGFVAQDEDTAGVPVPFTVDVRGSLMPFSNGRNHFVAAVQGVFYVTDWVGTVYCEVSYINQKGRVKTKTKSFTNGSVIAPSQGGWGNPRLMYNGFKNRLIGWSTPMPVASENSSSLKISKRLRVKLPNPVVNEVNFRIYSNSDGTSFGLKSFSIEKVDVGVIGDII